jgi:flagellar motor switch protein FliN
MNPANSGQATRRIREYFDLWTMIISGRLSEFAHRQVTTKELLLEATRAGAGLKDEQGTWVRFAAAPAGEQALFISAEDARKLQQWLEGPGPGKTEAGTDAGKAAQEFFIQAAAKFPAEQIQNSELKFSGTGHPVWESAVHAAFCFSFEQETSLTVHIHLSAELASNLQSAQDTVAAAEKGRPARGAHPSAAPVGPASDVCLDLLMDVELEVALRFGQREMLLRDILSIAPGTVLELDQQVHDPVELLVGNKVIARGEVVTVDGNYGLRITSLASSEERIESLRK